MDERYPLPFHDVDTHGSGIEENIGHVVVEQVDLIDIEDAPVDRREDTRIDGHHSFTDRPLHVDGAHHPVFGRPEREIDDADPALLYVKVHTRDRSFGTGAAHATEACRIATIRAAPDHINLGEHVGKRPDRSGFCSSFLTADEYSADTRVDGIEQECALHRLLADDSGERQDVLPCLVGHMEKYDAQDVK